MIDNLAGMQHGFRECSRFGGAEAANPHRHQPCGHLIVGNVAAGVSRHEKIDFFAGVFPGIAFFADEVNGAHAIGNDVRD